MGSSLPFFAATCVFRMMEPPYVTGGLSMMGGYLGAMLRRERRHDDAELVAFIRAYQRRALLKGKARATAEFEAERAHLKA
jgi:hypothetical protein